MQRLARSAVSSHKWPGYLLPHEFKLFEKALNYGEHVFDLFLAAKIPLRVRISTGKDSQVLDIDPVSIALKVRYMLLENEQKLAKEIKSSVSNFERDSSDDDYDDCVEEETVIPDIICVDAKSEDTEIDSRGKSIAVASYARMYETFENDLERMKRFARLKASDDEIQMEPETKPENSVAESQPKQFGSANLCLKNLLLKIENSRSEIPITDLELRNLISDVRKNRSKWANEERIGQEELYEACEKVVIELRGTTEHSTAFLNKVSKRDAPNYYDVIKNPMDLNTVMRKLRALSYNSKQEFVDDLELIWSNCLTFNSDPKHFLRVHALAMQKKTQQLAKLIPDIVIMSRAEMEQAAIKEEAEAQASERKRKSRDEGGKSSKRINSVKPSSSSGENNEVNKNPSGDLEGEKSPNAVNNENGGNDENKNKDEGDTSPNNNDKMDVDSPADQAVVHTDTTQSTDTPNLNKESTEPKEPKEPVDLIEPKEPTEPKESSPQTSILPTQSPPQDNQGSAKDVPSTSPATTEPAPPAQPLLPLEPETQESHEQTYPSDIESQLWEEISGKKRMDYLVNRKLQFVNDQLAMDASTMARSPHIMAKIDRMLRNVQMVEDDPLILEYEVMNGLPNVLLNDNSAWVNSGVPKVQDLPPSQYECKGQLNALVMENLNNMRLIRKLCQKILFIKDLQQGNPLAKQPPDLPEISDFEDISGRLPGANLLNGAIAQDVLTKSAAKIVLAAGFESAKPRALASLTSIAGDYMHKLASTLVAKLESPSSTSSHSDILKSSLEDFGVHSPNQLVNYIDKIARQGRKFSRFKHKLNSMLVEMLRPEVNRYKDEQFSDNSEQFVLGQFSNELGDDYFGFKELGLDKELGVASLSIPFHLLQQRATSSNTKQEFVQSQTDMPKFDLKSALSNQPTLFKGYFTTILNELETAHKSQPDTNINDFIDQKIDSLKMKASSAPKIMPKKRKIGYAYIVPDPKPEPHSPPPMNEQKPQPVNHLEPQQPQEKQPQQQEQQNYAQQPQPDLINDSLDHNPRVDISKDPFDPFAEADDFGFNLDDAAPTDSFVL